MELDAFAQLERDLQVVRRDRVRFAQVTDRLERRLDIQQAVAQQLDEAAGGRVRREDRVQCAAVGERAFDERAALDDRRFGRRGGGLGRAGRRLRGRRGRRGGGGGGGGRRGRRRRTGRAARDEREQRDSQQQGCFLH